MALARMGADVTFFTSLGPDTDAGSDHREPWRGGSRRAKRAKPQTRVLAVVDPNHDRTLFVIGENDHPTADDPLPWDELAEMDGVYFTGQDPAHAAARPGRAGGGGDRAPVRVAACRAESGPMRWSAAAATGASSSTSTGSHASPIT